MNVLKPAETFLTAEYWSSLHFYCIIRKKRASVCSLWPYFPHKLHVHNMVCVSLLLKANFFFIHKVFLKMESYVGKKKLKSRRWKFKWNFQFKLEIHFNFSIPPCQYVHNRGFFNWMFFMHYSISIGSINMIIHSFYWRNEWLLYKYNNQSINRMMLFNADFMRVFYNWLSCFRWSVVFIRIWSNKSSQ